MDRLHPETDATRTAPSESRSDNPDGDGVVTIRGVDTDLLTVYITKWPDVTGQINTLEELFEFVQSWRGAGKISFTVTWED